MNKEIKKELKTMCLPRLVSLCEEAGLSVIQANVVIDICNKEHDIYKTSVDRGMCETKVKLVFKKAIQRILDYKNYLHSSSVSDIKKVGDK